MKPWGTHRISPKIAENSPGKYQGQHARSQPKANYGTFLMSTPLLLLQFLLPVSKGYGKTLGIATTAASSLMCKSLEFSFKET